jgi:hypothetical protein
MTGAQGQPGMTGAQGQAGVTGAQGRPGVSGVANPAPAGASWTSLRDIMFDYNRPEIRQAEMSKIADIAAYTSQNPSVRLGIDGSTDLPERNESIQRGPEPAAGRQCSWGADSGRRFGRPDRDGRVRR